MIPTDLKEFDEYLKNHDWYYRMSDDHFVWKRGEAAKDKLNEFLKNKATDAHKRIYTKWYLWCFCEPNFSITTLPFPGAFTNCQEKDNG